jgi:hypothetical protein
MHVGSNTFFYLSFDVIRAWTNCRLCVFVFYSCSSQSVLPASLVGAPTAHVAPSSTMNKTVDHAPTPTLLQHPPIREVPAAPVISLASVPVSVSTNAGAILNLLDLVCLVGVSRLPCCSNLFGLVHVMFCRCWFYFFPAVSYNYPFQCVDPVYGLSQRLRRDRGSDRGSCSTDG